MLKRFIALVLSISLVVMALPLSCGAARDLYFEEQLAKSLKSLGLFQGVSDTDFALHRAPTRVEALIMLIRLLGHGKEAQESGASHPFTDVPTWADGYVGYAYEKGLTNGTSDTTFGTGTASAQMYLTFVLRALGYSDGNGEDFSWNNPYALAESVGIVPEGVDHVNFLRGDVVLVSYGALEASLKGSTQSLAQKLIDEGVFTYEQYTEYYDPAAFAKQAQGPRELSSEEIYNQCSPAVFYLEIYNQNGQAISSGSGFFLKENGVAVTNYHVIEDGYSAKITIPGTEEVYEVAGVYDYNKEYDWAVIQVNGSGFSTLKMGRESSVIAGAPVYAIGSPLGLKNTITQGLISNTNRWVDGVCYIQTSAAISHGSSGGALINKYGEVIGMTSAGFTEGQNLGLALPVSVFQNHLENGLTSMAEIAGINSPNPTEPQLSDNLSRREKAFALLLAVIETMGNDEINDEPAYTQREETENGYMEFSILENDDLTIDIIVWEVYEEDTYYTSLTLEPYSDEMFVFYSYNMEEDGYFFEGYTNIYAPAFTAESPFSFTHVKGQANRESNEAICKSNLVYGLIFVEEIFDVLAEMGDYSVSDLGFTAF